MTSAGNFNDIASYQVISDSAGAIPNGDYILPFGSGGTKGTGGCGTYELATAAMATNSADNCRVVDGDAGTIRYGGGRYFGGARTIPATAAVVRGAVALRSRDE